MKKKKIKLHKLLLQKQTIASMNADSVYGGTQATLETKVVVVCKTLVNTILTIQTVPITNPVTNSRKTYCITECVVCI